MPFNGLSFMFPVASSMSSKSAFVVLNANAHATANAICQSIGGSLVLLVFLAVELPILLLLLLLLLG